MFKRILAAIVAMIPVAALAATVTISVPTPQPVPQSSGGPFPWSPKVWKFDVQATLSGFISNGELQITYQSAGGATVTCGGNGVLGNGTQTMQCVVPKSPTASTPDLGVNPGPNDFWVVYYTYGGSGRDLVRTKQAESNHVTVQLQ